MVIVMIQVDFFPEEFKVISVFITNPHLRETGKLLLLQEVKDIERETY